MCLLPDFRAVQTLTRASAPPDTSVVGRTRPPPPASNQRVPRGPATSHRRRPARARGRPPRPASPPPPHPGDRARSPLSRPFATGRRRRPSPQSSPPPSRPRPPSRAGNGRRPPRRLAAALPSQRRPATTPAGSGAPAPPVSFSGHLLRLRREPPPTSFSVPARSRSETAAVDFSPRWISLQVPVVFSILVTCSSHRNSLHTAPFTACNMSKCSL